LFLKYNGFKISATQDDLYDFCLLIANHETRPELEEIEDWIRVNTEPYIIDLKELSDLL
jgi:prophage maintenance system killer protein